MARTGWLGPYLSPQTLLDPQLDSAADLLSPLYGEAAAAASAALEENGEGFTLLNQATLAVVLAAALATTARASTVTYWQEELAPQATAVAIEELYQLDTPAIRRVVCLAPDPDTPEIVPHLEEVYEYQAFAPRRPAALLGDLPSDEVIVAQPSTFGLDEIYWQAPDAAPTRIRGDVVYDTPEIVAQLAAFGLDEPYWPPASAIPTKVRGEIVYDTPEIVPLAASISIDELYWQDPLGRVATPARLSIVPDTPEIVPQPPPFPAWQDTWEPAFVRPPVRSLHVSQTQDEIVPTLHLQEYGPAPEMLVRAKPVVAFQAPPDDPLIVPFVDVSGLILRGILRLEPVFSASLALDETMLAELALSLPLSGQLALAEALEADVTIEPALSAQLLIQPPE